MYGLLALLILAASVAHAELVVVVPKTSPVESLTAQEVRNIFLDRKRRFSEGTPALPIELEDADLRAQFYDAIANKSTAQLDSYWATLIFTGKGRPPRRFEDRNALFGALESGPGFITYLRESAVNSTVKIVFRLP